MTILPEICINSEIQISNTNSINGSKILKRNDEKDNCGYRSTSTSPEPWLKFNHIVPLLPITLSNNPILTILIFPRHKTKAALSTFSASKHGRRTNFTPDDNIIIVRKIAAAKAHLIPLGEVLKSFSTTAKRDNSNQRLY